jgi:hypothetical protein
MFKEITSYEAACVAIKEDPNNLPIVSHLSKEEGEDIINNTMLKRIVKAVNLNDDGSVYKANYVDGSTKYEMGFGISATKAKPSGVGFSCSFYDDWGSVTRCGSRLAFRSLDRLQHVQEHFKPLREKVYLFLD